MRGAWERRQRRKKVWKERKIGNKEKELNGRRAWGRRQGRRKDRIGKGIHVGEGPKRGGEPGEDDKEEGSEEVKRGKGIHVGEGTKWGGSMGRRQGRRFRRKDKR
jgi:hypothetical protein